MSSVAQVTKKELASAALQSNPPAPADQQRVDDQKTRRWLRRTQQKGTTTMSTTDAPPINPALPANYDDPKSPYYVNPDIRSFWDWTESDEQEFHKFVANRLSKGRSDEIVYVPSSRQRRKETGQKWDSKVVRLDTDEGFNLVRHGWAEQKARKAKAQAESTARTRQRIRREDTCAICGNQVAPPPAAAAGRANLAGVTHRTVLTPSGQVGVRCCGKCLVEAEHQAREQAAAELVAGDLTRAQAVGQWLSNQAQKEVAS